MDSSQDELSPSDPIESVCQPLLNILAPVKLLLPVLLSCTLRTSPVPVAIGLNPPASKDGRTQVGCIGHVCMCQVRKAYKRNAKT